MLKRAGLNVESDPKRFCSPQRDPSQADHSLLDRTSDVALQAVSNSVQAIVSHNQRTHDDIELLENLPEQVVAEEDVVVNYRDFDLDGNLFGLASGIVSSGIESENAEKDALENLKKGEEQTAIQYDVSGEELQSILEQVVDSQSPVQQGAADEALEVGAASVQSDLSRENLQRFLDQVASQPRVQQGIAPFLDKEDEDANDLLCVPGKNVTYLFGNAINFGGFGTIHLSKDSQGNDIILKVSREADEEDEDPDHTYKIYRRVANEAEILKVLKGDNHFVQYIDSFTNPKMINGTPLGETVHVIVMEKLPRILSSIRGSTLSVDAIDKMLRQGLEAIKVMTDKKIIHQDIDDSCMSWDGENLKIFDFSISTMGKDSIVPGDEDYFKDSPAEEMLPPEKLLGLSVDQKTDMWTLAQVLFEFYTDDLLTCTPDKVMHELLLLSKDKLPVEILEQSKNKFQYFKLLPNGNYCPKAELSNEEIKDFLSIGKRIVDAAIKRGEYTDNKAKVDRLANAFEDIFSFVRPPAEEILRRYYS